MKMTQHDHGVALNTESVVAFGINISPTRNGGDVEEALAPTPRCYGGLYTAMFSPALL